MQMETDAVLDEQRYFQDESSAPMPQNSMLPPMHHASFMVQRSNVATRADGAYWAHRPDIIQAATGGGGGNGGAWAGQGSTPEYSRMQALQ